MPERLSLVPFHSQEIKGRKDREKRKKEIATPSHAPPVQRSVSRTVVEGIQEGRNQHE